MDWFYVSDSHDRLPFDERDIRSLVRGRVVRPETMVWEKGMDDWVSASEIHPEWFSAAAAAGDDPVRDEMDLVRETARHLVRRRGWVFFGAGVLVVAGVAGLALLPYALTGPGGRWTLAAMVVFPTGACWVLAGVAAVRAALRAGRALATGQRSTLGEAVDHAGLAAQLIGAGIVAAAAVAGLWAVVAFAMWGRFLGPFAG